MPNGCKYLFIVLIFVVVILCLLVFQAENVAQPAVYHISLAYISPGYCIIITRRQFQVVQGFRPEPQVAANGAHIHPVARERHIVFPDIESSQRGADVGYTFNDEVFAAIACTKVVIAHSGQLYLVAVDQLGSII